MTTDLFATSLRDALSRAPDSAWIREDLALVGWGASTRIDPGTGADRFDRALRVLRSTGAPLALASFTFDENVPGSIAVVPDVLISIDPEGARFLIGDVGDLPDPRSMPDFSRGRLFDPGEAEWISGVEDALAAIRTREVEKVVLSRILTVDLEAAIPPHLVLANLAVGEPGSHTFLVDRLVGSSPELLISLHGGRARSVSLAGSADLEDRMGLRSFDSEKMLREHALAADSVEDALGPFSPDLKRSPSRIATYGEIRHLSTVFEGGIHPGTLVTDLLSALHPTAAVAGTPTKSALELIRELERHDRGRYAGPVGWLDPAGEGEFAIALRCGLIDGHRATLYTGAGLVDGSDPGVEFEETQIKLRPMLGALGLIRDRR
jgi:menaquinone-specific isochorismate synthase